MNYVKILDDIFKQFDGPRFGVRLWGNNTKYYGDESEQTFVLHITKPAVVKKLLAEGALGFGESYMDGTLDIEGDLESYLKLRHQFKHVKPSIRLIVARLFAELVSPRDRSNQISYHYDLGNDFFSLFLDKETVSYSAAHFESENESLGAAQLNKLRLVCDWLNLPNNSSVLDLGSGWSGFATYAAREHGWDITGITLSKKQLDYSKELEIKQNLNDKVSIRFEDFTSTSKDLQYNGVVMIEAIEHVGKDRLNTFMSEISKNLKQGAPFYVQFTGRYKPKLVDPWTLKYVFPGGHLPAKQEFLDAVEYAGLKVEKFEDNTDDYKKTMAIWINLLESHQKEIEEMFDKKFFRLWKLWMHGAYVNFDIGDMNLFRVLMRKP